MLEEAAPLLPQVGRTGAQVLFQRILLVTCVFWGRVAVGIVLDEDRQLLAFHGFHSSDIYHD